MTTVTADDMTRDELAYEQYRDQFAHVITMTTDEMITKLAKIDNFLSKANTLDGRVYVAAVRAYRCKIVAELSRLGL